MFKKNEDYRQQDMFDLPQTLSDKQNKLMSASIEHSFFLNIFMCINENDFSRLYSKKKSRPNTPVNQLVGSLILKHLHNWTYSELFKNLNFNILTRHAVGINSIETDIFSEATIYNFQTKVVEHFVSTGTDLLSEVFETLTQNQLKEFGVRTNIQRGDSFLMGSNIFDYTRLQLLIEVLLRLNRILDAQDKSVFSILSNTYTKQSAGQYIYKIEKDDLPKEINKLANIYHKLYVKFKDKYSQVSVFKIFERVYTDHFIVVNEKVEVIPNGKLNSSILMSPDDQTATYRDKRDNGNKGYSGHISETAHPDNKLNLITDNVVETNNTDDAKILEKRLPFMIDKTPDLDEYHSDGGYGSPNVDLIMNKHSITQIQNAIRGRKAAAEFTIREDELGQYWVSCKNGETAIAKKADKRYKAVFDYYKCQKCPFLKECSARTSGVKINRPIRTWYFAEEKILLHRRRQSKERIPKERWKLRSNVEASVKEVKRGIKNKKVRVRGIIKARFYLSLTCIAVNLTRIHKYLPTADKGIAGQLGLCEVQSQLETIFWAIRTLLCQFELQNKCYPRLFAKFAA